MNQYFPGATVVGIAFNEGAILAAERRYTYGNYIVSKNVQKVFPITDNTAAACAGMRGDMQVLVRNVQSLIKIKQLETRRVLGPGAIAKLMSVLMFQNRMFPLLTQVIVGGFDKKTEIYVLDPIGSIIPDKYSSVGTGEAIAIGVIENEYSPTITKDQAETLAVKAIKSAIQRDSTSGDGVDLLVITKNGMESKSISF